MGKTAATIKLIQILSSRNSYISTKELAELIDTNARNIKEYIKEAEECGYKIDSLAGVYGGYRMNKQSELPAIKLSKDEKRALKECDNYLKDDNKFSYQKELSSAIGKVISSIENDNPVTPQALYDRFPLSMPLKDLEYRYKLISEAIESQYKIEIEYNSLKNTVRNHIIHPYKLFCYNGAWFVIAYNETALDVGSFKLNRIVNLFRQREHFSIPATYQECDYLDEFGMKKNGDYYKIKLELNNLNTVINERIYGKNQKVEEIDQNTCILECDMQNKDMILSFVLSFGSNVKVLEPDWLKEDLNNELMAIIDKNGD